MMMVEETRTAILEYQSLGTYEEYGEIACKIADKVTCNLTEILYISELGDGQSGDSPILIKIINAKNKTYMGYHVLKVHTSTSGSLFEAERENTQKAAKFADKSVLDIPNFIMSGEVKNKEVNQEFYVYGLAGDGLTQGKALSKQDSLSKMKQLGEISKRIFKWCNLSKIEGSTASVYGIAYGSMPKERLSDKAKTGELVKEFIKDKWASAFKYEGECLPNPFSYIVGMGKEGILRKESEAFSPAFVAQCHGDFHTNNIIITHNVKRYTLIDFAYYKEKAPMFYDHAYLMFSACLEQFAISEKDLEFMELKQWHSAFTEFFSDGGIFTRSPEEFARPSILNYMRTVQDVIDAYIREHEPNKRNLQKQCLATHIAVGLRFIGKSYLNPMQQRVAFLYAAHAVKCLELLEGRGKLFSDTDGIHELTLDSITFVTDAWRQMGRFSKDNKYILITASGKDLLEDASCLAPIRWGVVLEIPLDRITADADTLGEAFRTSNHHYHYCEISADRQPDVSSGDTWMQMRFPKGIDKGYFKRYLENRLREALDLQFSLDSNETIYILFNGAGLPHDLCEAITDTFVYANSDRRVIRILTRNIQENLLSADNAKCEELNCTIEHLVERYSAMSMGEDVQSMIRIPSAILERYPSGFWQVEIDYDANYATEFTLVHRYIADNLTDDDGYGFYRGNEATWHDIEYHRDISRDCCAIDKWYEKINDEMNNIRQGESRQINLYHAPGSGGTTMKKRIAWDYCCLYPTLILEKYSEALINKFIEISGECDKPLLILVEMNDGAITIGDIDSLRADLRREAIRALIICVSRANTTNEAGTETGNAFYLPNRELGNMDNRETQRFARHYIRLLDSNRTDYKEVKARIEKLADSKDRAKEWHPTFFGLAAFGDEYTGAEKYVNHFFSSTETKNVKVLNALALLSVFSQTINLSLSEIGSFIDLCNVDEIERSLHIKEWIAERPIIVKRESGYRFQAPYLGGLWLKKSLEADIAESDGKALLSYAKEFVSTLTPMFSQESARLNNILRELFMHREVIEDETIEKPKFSQLLLSLRTRENCVEMMTHMIKEIGDDPHCHNHLARVYLYMDARTLGIDCINAEESAQAAVNSAKRNKNVPESAHHHVLGLVYTKWCAKTIKESAKSSNEEILKAISKYYSQAVDAFDKSVATAKFSKGYGLIAKIQLVNGILREFKYVRRNWNVDFSKNEAFVDLLSMANETMTIYKRKISEPTAYYYMAVDEFCNHVGDTNALEHFLKNDGLDLERRARLNRAIVGIMIKESFTRHESLAKLDLEKIEKAFAKVSENVENSLDTEGDRWNWFELFRLIPEQFELERAYCFVRDWPEGDNNQDVCYYRYVLAYLLYLKNGKVSAKEVKGHFQRCSDLCHRQNDIFVSQAKNRRSTLDFCGKLDAEKDTGRFLQMVLPAEYGGEIEHSEEARIKAYQNFRRDKCEPFTGRISKQNSVLSVRWEDDQGESFVAETPHLKSYNLSEADISKSVWVSFYIGFSCSGLRAWDLKKV